MVVRNEEVVARILRETLRAVPGHILDRHQSPMFDQDHVQISVRDDGVVNDLDNAR